MLLSTLGCMHLFKFRIAFSAAVCPGVKLDFTVLLILVFWGISKLFSIVVTLIYIIASGIPGVLSSPHSCQHLLIVQFLIVAILTGEWWQFTVVLIFISVRMSSVEYSFNVLVCHLWVLFGKMSIQVFCLSFKLACFFDIEFHACMLSHVWLFVTHGL